jgi:hypothetical protein
MYSTCLHCHAALGRNESIEAFPVGKRLAFDAAKGRLWVICPSCGRWNLTPLEERWEAVEDCERQFAHARQRVSRGEIGLAQVRSGVELVRIGAPAPSEMAAWRYGRVLRKRWVTRGLPLATLAAGAGGLQFFTTYSPETLIPSAVAATGFLAFGLIHAFRVRSRIALPDGTVAKLRLQNASRAMLQPTLGDGWRIQYSHGGHEATLSGVAATHTLRGLLTMANYSGARDKDVNSAIELLGQAGSPARYIHRLARAAQASGTTELRLFPRDIRSALEMALHDDAERRAMEGELDDLRAEWERAEEIASIADNMFLPAFGQAASAPAVDRP